MSIDPDAVDYAIGTLRGSRAALKAALPIVKAARATAGMGNREAEMTAAWVEEQIKTIEAALAKLGASPEL